MEFLMMMTATCWLKEHNHDRCDDESARFVSLANLDLTNAQILFSAGINFFNQYLLQLQLYENAETFHCILYWKRF